MPSHWWDIAVTTTAEPNARIAVEAICGEMAPSEFAQILDRIPLESNKTVHSSTKASDIIFLEMQKYLADYPEIKKAMAAYNKAAVTFIMEYQQLKGNFGLA